MQVLLQTVESELEKNEKKAIVKEYTNVYTTLYMLMTFSYLIVTFMFFQHPATTNRQLFLTAVYSFRLEPMFVKILLYGNQIFLLLQAFSIPHLDLLVAILIYMCTDRLKQLEIDFRTARGHEELVVCIREHQRILK